MRSFGTFALTCAVCLGANYVFAQAVEDAPLQFDPYNKHHDRHLGHNHVYPDRGAVFRDAPKGSIIVNYAGLAYRFYNGVWFEPRGPAFIVVMPPIGVVVPSLPFFATTLKSGGETYLYANDVYYLPRPDLGGYEVVNEPDEPPSPLRAAAPAAGTAAAVSSSALPVGATAVATPVTPIAKTRLASLGTAGLEAAPGVASAQATSKVPGAPQTLSIPSEPEDNADAEIKAYSYAPDTAQPASKAAGALIVPAVAGASLAVTQAGASAPATSAAPTASNWTVTEIRGTKTVSASAVQGSAAFGTARSVANNSTAGPQPATGAADIPATPSAPAPAAVNVPAAAGAAAVGVAPALAINTTTATAAAIAGPTPATAVSPAAVTGSEGPIHLAANPPSVATPPPPQPVANTPPAPSTSTVPSVAPNANAAEEVTPHSSAGYRYTSPPSASDYPAGGTVHTTETPAATTVPAPAGTTTTSPSSGATSSSATTLSTAQQPAAASSSASQGGIRFAAYPRNGQTPDQQARDQYDCYRFGVAETGFDPMSGTVPAAGKPGQAEFDRARAACFEGRGYSLNK